MSQGTQGSERSGGDCLKETVSLKFLSARPRNGVSEWVTGRSGVDAMAWAAHSLWDDLECASVQRELMDPETPPKDCVKFGLRPANAASVDGFSKRL